VYLEKKHKCDLWNIVTVKQLIVCHALFLKSKETNTFKVTGKQKETSAELSHTAQQCDFDVR